MDLDTLFAGMEKSTTSDRSDFFKSGLYTVTTKSFELRDGHKGLSFIARFKVLESNNPELTPGSTRSWIIKLDGTKDQKARAMGDIKGLIFALGGQTAAAVGSPEKNPQAHADAAKAFKCAVDETYAATCRVPVDALIDLPVKLEVAEVDTKPTPTNPNGGKFSRHAWSPAEG